jgi:peptidoglycan-associated lipoprotein
MKRIVAVALFGLMALGLAGCPKPATKPAPEQGQAVAPAGSGASTGASPTDDGRAQPLGDASGQGAAGAGSVGTTVYFDFDSAEIKPEFQALIAAQGKHLVQGGTLRLRLEGNTDERGSPEYNIGLGERRAQAVKKALALQGGRADQLVTVSYGEERPAVEGHTEEAWAKNRRVDIVTLTP